ncbi:hypothetical protein [Brevibacillus halotolerans]|uniref:hypothetical protein n=1 Tax=Brevibacillus halotolerans TaxID=1507437 RepID=UPI0015EED527|nr:hypothetical protein [Brevibacillus halotolerans]MBA4535152.1 hypothetical protein [Brevibacillus halotolerans]
MSKKIIYKLIIGTVILALSVSVSCSLIIVTLNANKDWIGSLIGALGNIIGGILGGYIAYFVASFQIEESNKTKIDEEKKESINLAIVVKEELRSNSLVMDAILQGESSDLPIDARLIKHNLTREAWLFFSSRVAHQLDENLFVSLNTIYRKIQVFQSMSLEEINDEISRDTIRTMKYQFDDCIRKLEDFRVKLKNNSPE